LRFAEKLDAEAKTIFKQDMQKKKKKKKKLKKKKKKKKKKTSNLCKKPKTIQNEIQLF